MINLTVKQLTWKTNSLVLRGIGILGVDSPLAPDIEIQQLAVVWLALRDGTMRTRYGNSANKICFIRFHFTRSNICI